MKKDEPLIDGLPKEYYDDVRAFIHFGGFFLINFFSSFPCFLLVVGKIYIGLLLLEYVLSLIY